MILSKSSISINSLLFICPEPDEHLTMKVTIVRVQPMPGAFHTLSLFGELFRYEYPAVTRFRGLTNH
jgi:hypothetical protein